MNVREIVEKHGNHREHLLQILHDIQDRSADHSLHEDTLRELSRIMDIPLADLVGTASFYSLFSLTPRGRHIIRLCESPPCYISGSDNILAAITSKLGIGLGETTADGRFTLETTSCLGACGVAPVMMIDDEVYGNLTAEQAADILDRLGAAEPPAAGKASTQGA